MFILEDGREHLYQWDIDRRLQVEDATITEVHFCNKTDDCSLVVKTYTDDTYDGKVYADIPNILLQETWDIRVYAYCGGKYTKVEDRFKVKARTKPSDYVYTETEVVNYETLLNKMESIEENIGQAVEDYLYENPIEAGATDEQVAQINRNTQDIADIDREIADLPTKEYVDKAVQNVQVDLTGYATEQWVANQGYLKDVPSEYVTESELGSKGYATRAEIPTVPTNVSTFTNDAKYATETYVDNAIANIEIPEGEDVDLSDYYTKEETDTAIYDSKDAYYVALTNIPVGEENAILASDELTEFATRFVADRNVCLHIQETGNDTTRGYMSATITYVGGIISFTCSVIDPINIRDNSAIIYYNYKLKKNANSEWTIYKDLIGQFAITTKEYVDTEMGNTRTWVNTKGYATKEYVDGLFAGIATAEGGSY